MKELLKYLIEVEFCDHCLRSTRIVLALVFDVLVCLLVLFFIKALGATIAWWFHDYESIVLSVIDFYGKAGVLSLLALLLIRDIWKQAMRHTSPPCRE